MSKKNELKQKTAEAVQFPPDAPLVNLVGGATKARGAVESGPLPDRALIQGCQEPAPPGALVTPPLVPADRIIQAKRAPGLSSPAQAPLPHGVTPEARQRLRIVRWVLDGHTVTEAAERFGFHRNTIGDWVKRFRDLGPQGLNDRPAPIVRRKHSNVSLFLRDRIREARISHPEWTLRQLTSWLAAQRLRISPSTAYRVGRDIEPRVRVGQLLLCKAVAPSAGDVRITGDFIDWSLEGIALQRSASTGEWWLGLKLEPADYACRFLVDGWMIMLPENIESGRRGAATFDIEGVLVDPSLGPGEPERLLRIRVAAV